MNPSVDETLLKLYKKWGVEAPSHEEHGQFNETLLVPFKAIKWWTEGGILYGEGNHGLVANRIPTDVICKGTDENGLPILEKLAIT
jgi:hypothetical protein